MKGQKQKNQQSRTGSHKWTADSGSELENLWCIIHFRGRAESGVSGKWKKRSDSGRLHLFTHLHRRGLETELTGTVLWHVWWMGWCWNSCCVKTGTVHCDCSYGHNENWVCSICWLHGTTQGFNFLRTRNCYITNTGFSQGLNRLAPGLLRNFGSLQTLQKDKLQKSWSTLYVDPKAISLNILFFYLHHLWFRSLCWYKNRETH